MPRQPSPPISTNYARPELAGATVWTVAIVSLLVLSMSCGPERPTAAAGTPTPGEVTTPRPVELPRTDIPARVLLETATEHTPVLDYDRGPEGDHGHNFAVFTAFLGGRDAAEAMRLGVLPGSVVDLRTRHWNDEETFVLADLQLTFQDLFVSRGPLVPNGLRIEDARLALTAPTAGKVVARRPGRVDLELSLDLELSMRLGVGEQAEAAELPPIVIEGFSLVLTLEHDANTGATRLGATGLHDAAILDVPFVVTLEDIWLDLNVLGQDVDAG